MKLFATSDLHIDHLENRKGLEAMTGHPDDWLVVAGDISHSPDDLSWALDLLSARFGRVVWVPGNHDLWTLSNDPRSELKGQARYEHLVEICRARGVLTPEDPYETVEIENQRYRIAPLFLLYDYSFRPDGVPVDDAVTWAKEDGILCTDEFYLHAAPYPSRAAWCSARCAITERRLAEASGEIPLVLVNHFPLRRDLIRIRIPRFSIWCGTRRTEEWHQRFNVALVVSGHLHVRAVDYRDGVRFEEVSLGYPRHWHPASGIDRYLRQVLPARSGGRAGFLR